MHSGYVSNSHPRPARQTDEGLRARIDAAIGGSAPYTSTLMLYDEAREELVMLFVVERCSLPTDDDLRLRFDLTPRESEVARLMADRLHTLEISRLLGISIHTVRRHSERVLAKLKIHSRDHVRAALTNLDRAPAVRHAPRIA